MFGRFAIPFYGFRIIPFNAFAISITTPKIKLCKSITLFSRFAKPFCGFPRNSARLGAR